MSNGGRITWSLSEPVFNSNGNLVANATLTVYETGTTTLASIYADSGLTTLVANPQVSNLNGLFYDQSTSIFANTSIAYDYNLDLGNGQQYFASNQYVLGPAPNISGYLQNPNVQLTGSPTTTTPAVSDDSSKIASTAFVASALTAYTAANFPVPLSEIATINSQTMLANITNASASPSAISFPSFLAAIPATVGSSDTTIPLFGNYLLKVGSKITSVTNGGASYGISFNNDFPTSCVAAFAILINNSGSPTGGAMALAVHSLSTSGFNIITTSVDSGGYGGFYWAAVGY